VSALAPHRGPQSLGQLARFAVVGASNTAVTFIAYILLGLALPAVAAAALAWTAGAANGYRLNRGWTFASDARGFGVGARYAAVQGVAAGVDAGGVWLLRASWSSSSRIVAELVAIPAASLLAFVLCRRWVFDA
jgi:putative flippase GtrA